MHYYRGMIYFALAEMATMEAMSGKTPDEALMEKYTEISKESFLKVVNDTDKRKGYQEDAKSFIDIRVKQYWNIGLGMYESKNYEMAMMGFIGSYEVSKFIGVDYEDAKINAMAMFNVVTDSLLNAGEFEKTEELANLAQDAFGKDMSILTTLINAALKQGDKEKSENYINQALELDPNNKELYYILGTSYIELKENEKAEQNLLRAIEIDSVYVNAHSNLAALYMQWSLDLADEGKDLDYRDPRVEELNIRKTELLVKAIPSLEIMAVAYPDNKSVIRNLAQAYRASGNEEKFQEWYDKLKN
jgi:tetratricopeptide (TPR) repeat protein